MVGSALPRLTKRQTRLPLGHGYSARQSSRGTRIKVGATGSLKQILFGPAEVDDGSQNLVGAITTSWAT